MVDITTFRGIIDQVIARGLPLCMTLLEDNFVRDTLAVTLLSDTLVETLL